MTPKEFEEMVNPIIIVIAPILSIIIWITIFKNSFLRKVFFGFFGFLLSLIPDQIDGSPVNKDAEIDDNNANPGMIGTTAFYRKQQDE